MLPHPPSTPDNAVAGAPGVAQEGAGVILARSSRAGVASARANGQAPELHRWRTGVPSVS
jgi:hypothetical protein